MSQNEHQVARQLITYLNFGSFPGMIQFSSGFTYDEIMEIQKDQEDAEDWRSALKDDKELIDSGKYFGLVRELDGHQYYYIILTGFFDFSDDAMIILAHEILHLCQFRLRDTLDRNMEIEAEAYTHSHIMRQCLNALRGNFQ